MQNFHTGNKPCYYFSSIIYTQHMAWMVYNQNFSLGSDCLNHCQILVYRDFVFEFNFLWVRSGKLLRHWIRCFL